MFYRLGTRGFALDIFVDGVKVGSFSSFARILIPNCGDENAFTVDNLTEGSHKYEARETGTPNPVILKGSVTVVVDQCTKELLVYDWWGG
ncbi:MAG: hypothetical protein ABIN80_11935 [Dyadobacter sp.]|uniref:hypothetical protein n=1 Tax=Dyadobacter sp. TaxID=1914288 RepID=UPI003265CE18